MNKDIEKETEVLYKHAIIQLAKTFSAKRHEKKVSLRDIYKKTHVSIAVLSDFENYHKLPRIESLIKIAIVLDIPLSEMFSCLIVPTEISDNPMNTLNLLLSDLGYKKEDKKDIVNYMKYIKCRDVLNSHVLMQQDMIY